MDSMITDKQLVKYIACRRIEGDMPISQGKLRVIKDRIIKAVGEDKIRKKEDFIISRDVDLYNLDREDPDVKNVAESEIPALVDSIITK